MLNEVKYTDYLKIFKLGNSLALILTKPLNAIEAGNGDMVKVEVINKIISITLHKETKRHWEEQL